jgi:hypothetical protein
MSWILTASGREIALARTTHADITLHDISHALGQINRYAGHCRRPYSVAEHSLLVADIAQRRYGLDVSGQLAALMHDGHEAYVGDVSSPVKELLDHTWHNLEARVERSVRIAFSILVPCDVYRDIIKACDIVALATERAQLMPKSATPWPILEGVEPATWVDLMDTGRMRMTWSDWAAAFRDKADELDFARNSLHFARQPA